MSAPDSQNFLRELDKKLWTAADRLRSNLDAAVYKHAVLGQFALAEEKSGGHWTRATKTSPQSRVYDSAISSGGFFVTSERVIEEHGGKLANPPFNIKY